MSELKIGSILEIGTASGLAYIQYTHHHPACGEVVRLLPGLHDERPMDFAGLARRQDGRHVLLPLRKALGREGSPIAVVGWQPLSPSEQRFPTFRMAIRDRQGNVLYWWLWNGTAVWPQAELSAEQQRLPLRAVSSAEELIADLEREAAAAPA